MTATRSAIHSKIRMMPVEDLAPKMKTKKGMASVPRLGMPVFDKPMTKAPNTYTRTDQGEDNKDKAVSNIKCKNRKTNIYLVNAQG